MARSHCLIGLVIVVLILLGCSSGAGSSASPTIPSLSQQAATESSASGGSKVLWGVWDIAVDTQAGTVGIVPLRDPNFTSNVVKFLQPPAGISNGISVKITDLSEFLTEGRMVLDVTLRHPFPGLDQFTGFDVYGVFIHEGGLEFSHAGNMIGITDGVQSAILENADGYTLWMTPKWFLSDGTIFTYLPGALGTEDFPVEAADVNGFKYFADGLASDESVRGFFTDDANSEMRGKFSPGSANTRQYVIRFPHPSGTPIVKFQYAVTANWDLPDETQSGDPDVLDVPWDFPPSANASEPIHIEIVDHSTTWYVDDNNRGGDIIFDLGVYDWQMFETIYVSSVNDLVPGGMVAIDPHSLFWVIGYVDQYTTVKIPGAMPSSVAEQEIFVTVEPYFPVTYDQGFGSPAPDLPLAAYARHMVTVANEAPVEIDAFATYEVKPYFDGIGPDGSSDYPMATEWFLALDASGSTGPIDQYLWEMNGDDLFDEAEGMVVQAAFPDPGTHAIKLKVTDGLGGEDIYQLPDTFEVVKGTYVWGGYGGGSSDGSRDYPYTSILSAVDAAGQNGYILVRGDNNNTQCVYSDDLLLTADNSGTTIQGYYGDYGLGKPPMQTGYVRVEGDDITLDGFEVTGDSYSHYEPFEHDSKLGVDGGNNILFRHLYIHDINPTIGKAILAWFSGSLTVENCLEAELNEFYQKNQAHEDTTDPAPQLDFVNCTFDRLDTKDVWVMDVVGLYVSSGGGADAQPSVRNCIWTDIAEGAGTRYLRRQGPLLLYADYTCTFDTPTPPDGGQYYQGVDEGTHNVQADPLYVDPYTDHHLQPGSPCIDTGDPAILDSDDSVSDIGCYGGPYGDWNFEN